MKLVQSCALVAHVQKNIYCEEKFKVKKAAQLTQLKTKRMSLLFIGMT